jgi:amidohydrolase
MHRQLRLASVLLFTAAVGAPMLAQTQPPAATTLAAQRARVEALATELHPAVIEIRRDIHRNPELGFREKRTSALVAEKLRSLKFDEVRTGVGVTGVVGVLKGGRPGPVVAIRADMDALPIQELIDVPYKSLVPNVKHACGHDGHTAMALGVAEIFSRMRADLSGTVVFLFQPAEEGDPDGGKSGAVRVLEDWPFTNPTPAAIFGLHIMPTMRVGQIGYNSGPAMAGSARFTIKIIGKSTHGAMPHTGVDPMPVAAQVVQALQTIPARMIDAQTPTVLSVGTISGGLRFNVIADSITMTGTTRSLNEAGLSTVKTKMTQMLQGITTASGASFEFNFIESSPVVFNNPALVAASLPALEAAAGKANVSSPPPQMVSEDFAFYQQKIPGFYFFLGINNPEKGITAMWHTEYFDLDEEALRVGMKAMAGVVLQYLNR